MYAKVKKLSTKKSVSSWSTTIDDDKGTILKEPEEVRKRWKEYIEELTYMIRMETPNQRI